MSHPALAPPPAKSNAVCANNAIPTSPALDVLLTRSLSDHADPASSLGFLTCTLNSTNQILHPCILVALFGGDGRDGPGNDDNDDGTISWNPRRDLTPLPPFYADGAARPLARELITAIVGGEMDFVIDAVERLLSPRGYGPITALHGGEPIGRRVMSWLGNSPRDLGERSGLTREAMRREWRGTFGGGGGGRATWAPPPAATAGGTAAASTAATQRD
jgi:hypothetical protein